MSDFGDYRSEMPPTRLGDREVEQLLSSSTEIPEDLADLEQFLKVMSGVDKQPPGDVEFMATSLAAVARDPRRPRKIGFRRMAVLAASMAILFAFSGIAMAADGASPGDVLYGLDQVLEKIGIGAGGVDERIEEFDDLLDSGDEIEAYVFFAGYIGSTDDTNAQVASEHLVSATDASSSAVEAREKVDAILAFIEAGRGDGLEGRDLGRGVANIARGDSNDTSGGTVPGFDGGPPTNPGPPDGVPATPSNDSTEQPGQEREPGPPDNAGPPEQPGPPDNAGPPGQPGSSDEAGPPDQTGPPEDKGSSERSTSGTNPGENAPGATNPGKSNDKANNGRP